ncbi:MAG: phage portal protein [Aureliella sp.]
MLPNIAKRALAWAGKATGLQYDAINPRGRRRNPGSRVNREDAYAKGKNRNALQANAADLCRNLSLGSWMVRRHLDYVSQFSFHSRIDNPNISKEENAALNARIEQLMAEDNRPANADVAGKFSREKLFRLAEMRRVLDGDTLLVKMNDGRLQGIQSDLIEDPETKAADEEWINGVLVTAVGRPLSYSIKTRKSYTETKPDRRIDSTNVIHYGFFERYAADQVRGVSPLVAALNPLRDVYENFDYALAKAKVSQLFALAFYRDAIERDEDVEEEMTTVVDESGNQAQVTTGYKVDFGKGPMVLDLNDGDKAEFLESKTPSSEFQSFTQLIIQVALKALDIPFSFYDEAHTNFFGSRAAWLHYERSCRDKRDDQLEMRRNYTVWKLRLWIRDGRLVLPPGMTINDCVFEWQARGMPWWDPSKEVAGNVAAIGAGLDTPQRICKSADSDFYDNIDEIAKAQEYAKSKGVELKFVAPKQTKKPNKGAA